MRIWLESDIEREKFGLNDFFSMDSVLKTLGTDKQFMAYIRILPSCLSGTYGEYVNGDGRSIAAHVRRAGRSGIGIKPEYYCIPLTDSEHRIQHQHGESKLAPKDWFDVQAEIYRIKWAVYQIMQLLPLTGARRTDMRLIEVWAKKNGLYDELVALSF